MINKYRNFAKEHPYAHVILIALFASIIGISIEYIVNKDFIGGGLYTVLTLVLIQFIIIKRRKIKDED
ncbi:hypothetical protein [Marinilactibacillus psychrotolerans]|uniref:Uncharacterized protein n=1 Tax=Marinilactibacillus psychrotolerans TaxID=191770 RepID=A0AAV3WT56_9LACT|nr:hypothetical protein [Marinilactibacillus psychrotolerans]GEL66815.1 hypothetical protein MPS01_09700 [Marinilactibacillus psychrotolerans]GEQ35738.1 hypothetical protein M132T_12460 [Marinilactibacillus psychrotolerans]SDC35598.1 hypothetical protein SAMN04488013_104115 [Marinilactibacillus psychrotolerans]